MEGSNKNTTHIRDLTLFFGIFLLFTDVFFLLIGINYDMPLMRYVLYVKIVLNTSNLYFILNKHYYISTLIIYTVVLGFMITGVVCMGTTPEFQMYALGMIACIGYNGYLHKRILKKELPFALSIAIHVLLYAGVYLYARFNDPLYETPQSAVDILVIFNSVATFSIVIIYICLFHNIAIRSEEKLERLAVIDNLTGLYNRHYLLAVLDDPETEKPENCWLAILDIDNFKKVNDTYGHNCGDYILHQIAEISRQTCSGCIVCRWGGEEFVILSVKSGTSIDQLEKLRKNIADERFRFGKSELSVTVTIGAEYYDSGLTNDGWISKADEKLYYGKRRGKNQVVCQYSTEEN